MRARFNERDHCTQWGWATYGPHVARRRHLTCVVVGCAWTYPHGEGVLNGYSPQSYRECARCGRSEKFYKAGTHRYGSLDDDTIRRSERVRSGGWR